MTSPPRSRWCASRLEPFEVGPGDDACSVGGGGGAVEHVGGVHEDRDPADVAAVVLLVPSEASAELVDITLGDRVRPAPGLQLDHRVPGRGQGPVVIGPGPVLASGRVVSSPRCSPSSANAASASSVW